MMGQWSIGVGVGSFYYYWKIIIFAIQMLKTSIKAHDPQKIYDLLLKTIGPLYMMIRQGYAIIQFQQETQYQAALSQSKFPNMGIELLPYIDGQPLDEVIPEPKPGRELIKSPQSTLSLELQAISESLQIKDKQNAIETVIKQYRKNMIEIVTTYESFMTTINEKLKKKPNGSNDQIIFRNILDKRLKYISKNIKSGFNSINSELKMYGADKSYEIDLDSNIYFTQIAEKPLDCNRFNEFLQYNNEDRNSQIRQLCSLNQTHFICSSSYQLHERAKIEGKLKIYDINTEKQESNMQIKEGSIGLLLLDKYIIAGTYEGYFSFFHQDRTNFQELSPRLFCEASRQYCITDIQANNRRCNGYNILALAKDRTQGNALKSFYVEEYQLQSGIDSLIFEETSQIKLENRSITTIQILEEGVTMLAGCSSHIEQYDLINEMTLKSIQTEEEVFKIRRCNSNQAYFTHKNYISHLDIRTENPINYSCAKQVSALCFLNDNSLIYGTTNGELVLFDRRMQGKKILWSNTCNHFKQRIESIIKHGDLIISADNSGQIFTWKGDIFPQAEK